MAQRRRKLKPTYEMYIFEIRTFAPSYSLSVNRMKFDHSPYREHVSVTFEGVCIHPKRMIGRVTRFDLVGDRSVFEPWEWRQDKDWRPNCVGLLELPPTGGRFYVAMPNDSLAWVAAALGQGAFNYVSLWGPALSRGKSLCQSVEFHQTIDLTEY
jgi:hypothetical protein